MIRRVFTYTLMLSLMILKGVTTIKAQETVSDIVTNITSTGDNTIVQSEELLKLVNKKVTSSVVESVVSEDTTTPYTESGVTGSTSHTKMAGFRVQVFSDNNAHTAKNEARSKARDINGRFPQYRTYVMYTSPYWRLKVGDFRTQSEAEAAAEEIRNAFPAYGKEIRVVRDRITVQN